MNNFPTLCVLAYERPEYLRKMLDSLFDNTPEPYELIIHDDGSKNNYGSISDMMGCASTWIHNQWGWNQGQGVALNRMFGMAKGDPIIKLDADIEFTPGWLSKTTRLMEKYWEIGLLGLLHYYHDPVNSNKTMLTRAAEYTTHTHILGTAFALRRETWEELGPYEEYSEAFAEDWVMQQAVTKSDSWVCALPKEDLVISENMGLGKSVVVQGDGSVHKIHKTPYIINSDVQSLHGPEAEELASS